VQKEAADSIQATNIKILILNGMPAGKSKYKMLQPDKNINQGA
jgi:hypothetical protein